MRVWDGRCANDCGASRKRKGKQNRSAFGEVEHEEQMFSFCVLSRQTPVMTRATGACDVTQNRGWKSDRRFRLWGSGGALRGALLHQDSFVESFLEGLLSLALLFEVWGLILLVALLPALYVSSALHDRKQKALKARLDELDPMSEQYLEWEERSFCWRASQVRRVVFSGKATGFAWSSRDLQRMRLALEDGQMWQFTFGSRTDADRLEELLRAQDFKVSRV